MKYRKLALVAAMAVFSIVGTQSSTAQSPEATITGLMKMVASNVSSTVGAKFIAFTVGNIGDPVTVFVE